MIIENWFRYDIAVKDVDISIYLSGAKTRYQRNKINQNLTLVQILAKYDYNTMHPGGYVFKFFIIRYFDIWFLQNIGSISFDKFRYFDNIDILPSPNLDKIYILYMRYKWLQRVLLKP